MPLPGSGFGHATSKNKQSPKISYEIALVHFRLAVIESGTPSKSIAFNLAIGYSLEKNISRSKRVSLLDPRFQQIGTGQDLCTTFFVR